MLAPLPTHRKSLLDAADLIEQRGLAKLTRCDSEGRLCLHGAVAVAETGRHDEGGNMGSPAMSLVVKYLRARGATGNPHALCAIWNNERERTQAEVVAALRGAALDGL